MGSRKRLMVKFPYQRLAQAFAALQAEALPQEELARRLAVSTRTVRNDIDALNAILAEHGARFVLKRGEGYRLQADDPERFQRVRPQAGSGRAIPRQAGERVHYLLAQFLGSAYALKLQDLADAWCVSRATLQADMAEVRERLAAYGLSIEAKPHYGMKLLGAESSIRVCLSDLLAQLAAERPDHPLLSADPVLADALATVRAGLPGCLSRAGVRLSDDGAQFLTFYCAVAAKRIVDGFPLQDFCGEETLPAVDQAATHIVGLLRRMSGVEIAAAERAFLCVNIAARSLTGMLPSAINADDADALVCYILDYINRHYRYDLRADRQLREDLITHVKTMITRVRYQINLPNPVLADIKQHYALAYDFTLAAVSSWAKHSPYRISENEIGYLVLHIGVGLERHYQIGYLRRPQALLVCDGGNATLRTLEAVLRRRFPQLEVCASLSCQEYEALEHVSADFVVSTVRLEDKRKPVALLSPFPSDYQLEQLARLVAVDRTRPYMLERYFSAKHFWVAEAGLSQQALFERVCGQLREEGYVDADFLPSVREREDILSTMLGDGIALPHSLGLLARKTTVCTIIAPHGVAWGEGSVARVIFLLAISKTEYEEAMAIYELFVSFMRQRAGVRLVESRSFEEFLRNALLCLPES